MRKLTVFLASMNSSGIHKRQLLIEGNAIIGEITNGTTWTFIPSSTLDCWNEKTDWRVWNLFKTRREATSVYVEREQERIRVATQAIVELSKTGAKTT